MALMKVRYHAFEIRWQMLRETMQEAEIRETNERSKKRRQQ